MSDNTTTIKRHPNFKFGSVSYDKQLRRWRFSWYEDGVRNQQYFKTKEEAEQYREIVYPDYIKK